MFKNNLFQISFLLFSFILLSFNTTAQINFGSQNQVLEPIEWKANVTKSDSLFTLAFIAELEEGWHLPSMRALGEDVIGPIPTEFIFKNQKHYQLVGTTYEPEGIEAYDETFETDLKYFEEKVAFTQKVEITSFDQPIEVDVMYSVCDDKRCLPPETHTFRLQINPDGSFQALGQNLEVDETDVNLTNSLKLDIKNPELISSTNEEQSYMMLFFLGFIGGLLALLTPCVFPMIPLTVSFFTKGARTPKIGKINAILYGLFIFGIYLLLSLPFHLLDSVNPEILNNISTNTVLNIIFFIIFMAFAFSFFGYYEITLPQSWSNRMDQKAMSFGGIVGIFFMALTLAIVSFSCTGPILGSLLGGSLTADGGAIQLSFGMGGFGLALALPFALFALFPNWLKAMPQSGGWLNTVKVVLGFLEVGLAFKFLSNADLVENWGLLKREIFIAIWIIVGIAMVLYLLGKIKFPHDAKTIKLSKGRIFTSLIIIAFVIYLVPGLTQSSYANLKLLSGFPPPLNYSLYDKDSSGPLGLTAYKDFDKGLAAAKASGKPILIDFTGMACVNCRKMEEQVWSEPQVLETLQNDVILISLYVDKRTELPKDEQFNYKKQNGTIKTIKTIGDKWATFQTVNFKNNSQPYYVLMDSDLNLLNQPTGYEPDADVFLEWLENGIQAEN
ncbi:cytochrome c biogenesis protein CcdA [Psychroflexus sp. MBR-150]|jgi:thiol:disulfide interchange protein DsbD